MSNINFVQSFWNFAKLRKIKIKTISQNLKSLNQKTKFCHNNALSRRFWLHFLCAFTFTEIVDFTERKQMLAVAAARFSAQCNHWSIIVRKIWESYWIQFYTAKILVIDIAGIYLSTGGPRISWFLVPNGYHEMQGLRIVKHFLVLNHQLVPNIFWSLLF